MPDQAGLGSPHAAGLDSATAAAAAAQLEGQSHAGVARAAASPGAVGPAPT